MIAQYLKDGSLSDPVIDDAQNFQVCDDAMKHLGFSDSDRLSVYMLVAGVLHLGNIGFEENQNDTTGKNDTESKYPDHASPATRRVFLSVYLSFHVGIHSDLVGRIVLVHVSYRY